MAGQGNEHDLNSVSDQPIMDTEQLTRNLPRIIRLLESTPFGEVRIVTDRGRIVRIERSERNLPVE